MTALSYVVFIGFLAVFWSLYKREQQRRIDAEKDVALLTAHLEQIRRDWESIGSAQVDLLFDEIEKSNGI